MRPLLWLLALAACEGDGAKYPIVGGGGGGGGGGMHPGVDASVDGNDGGNEHLAGRVCLITDARQPTTCATTGADMLTVTLDGRTTTTAADGTFTIDAPTGTNIQWLVTGTDLVTSIMGFSAVHTIPAMKDVDYLDLANSNGVIGLPGNGDVFLHVTHGATNVQAVAATSAPAAEYATLYDGGAPTTWTQLGTGPFGMVWFAGLPQGAVTVTLTPQGGTATPVSTIPVGDQTLTWVSVELP